jgi:hypothetical protein
MSTATTTSHETGQHTTSRTTTQPTNNPTSQLERSAAQRLRTTMAAVRLAFTWLGVRKTLAPEQRTTAARAFHADRELLSASKLILDTKNPAYRAVAAVRSEASSYWRTVTLPFPEAGIRLLPQNSLGLFANTMQTYRERLQEAARELTNLCRAESWRLGIWNCDSGVQFPIEQIAIPGVTETQDPLAVIRAMPQVSQGSGTTILLFENLHRFLGSVELIQAIARQAITGKHNRAFIVVLAPVTQIPPELDKLFVCVDHELPDHAQLEEIARGVATQDGELPTGDELARVVDAAKGLTRSEAENAYSLSLVRHGTLKAETLWEIKAGQLKKSGLVSIHRGIESFQQLGGLDNLKAFCLRAMRRQGRLEWQRPRRMATSGRQFERHRCARAAGQARVRRGRAVWHYRQPRQRAVISVCRDDRSHDGLVGDRLDAGSHNAVSDRSPGRRSCTRHKGRSMTTLAAMVVGLVAGCALMLAGLVLGHSSATHARRKPRRRHGSPWQPSDN